MGTALWLLFNTIEMGQWLLFVDRAIPDTRIWKGIRI